MMKIESGCVADKSTAAVWRYHVNIDQIEPERCN